MHLQKGEVKVEQSRASLIIVMNATDPNTEYGVSVLNSLIINDFPQCIFYKQIKLCMASDNIQDTGTEREKLCYLHSYVLFC